MANFTAAQTITSTGLCSTLVVTDISDYTGNTQGIAASDIDFKLWVFRDSSGNIIKQETTDNTAYSSSCAISLLTLNVTVSLLLHVTKSPYVGAYTVQNGLLIPCLGI